jgi:hypothetical protein
MKREKGARPSRATTPRELKRLINIEMWQKQGDSAIFAAAWRLVELRHLAKGGKLKDLKMRRDIARFRKMPSRPS